MNIGSTYVDSLDPSRTLVPRSDGTTAVYFNGNFAGVARLGSKLFFSAPAEKGAAYGYVLKSSISSRAQRPGPGQDDPDFDDDDEFDED